MLIIAITIFIVTSLLGYQLISYLLKNKHIPKAYTIIHGVLAISGILLLGLYSYYHSTTAIIPVVVFIAVALGGIFLAKRDITAKPIPKWVAYMHAVGAIIAMLILLSFFQSL